MDYDPSESFNERTFSFNFNVLDRYALKPAANHDFSYLRQRQVMI